MQIVKEIMTSKVYYLALKDTLFDAYEVMKTRQISHIPVVEDQKVVGMLSQGDVLLHANYRNSSLELTNLAVAKIMSTDVVSCLPSASIASVAATMLCCRIEAIPVTDVDGCLQGIVTSTDLLDYLCCLEEQAGRNVMPLDFLERGPFFKHQVAVNRAI